MNEELIHLNNVKKYYPVNDGFHTKYLKAVDDISLDIRKGETLGLVGESGCGKSTLGRVILRLNEITDGQVTFNDQNIFLLKQGELKDLRKKMQIVFQDPYACLNPRLRIADIIAEPLRFHEKLTREELDKKVLDVIKAVGLSEDMMRRFPHELSGGQQQRVGIARALILRPSFIVCDEPVSALDVSVQAQILNLLVKLKAEYELTYLFISHNLAVVHHICDRIAVMYLGQIVELADTEELFKNPLHPYTKVLMSAVLSIDGESAGRTVLRGDLPDPMNPPTGCRFHTRCTFCMEKCQTEQQLVEVKSGHWVRCCLVNN